MSATAVEKMLMLPTYITSNSAVLMRPLAGLLPLLIALLLGACGGGGSSTGSTGDDAVKATDPVGAGISYADATSLLPIITAASIPEDGRAIIDFQLSNDEFIAITDLSPANFRLTLVKLESSELGGLTGNWQSYINKIEDPGVGPGVDSKLQANYERAANGTLTNNQDGTYRYRFAASVTAIPADISVQAEAEGLDLSYQPTLTHRVAMQFDNSSATANPNYDWIPSTGAVDPILHYDVVAIDNCNSCHGQLAVHGGARTQTKYCVTCHNPGSSDANSGNSVDFKQMIHKIHRGADLPSVVAGGEYAIWGFNDSKHDYSTVKFPRDIGNCQVCHAGSATGDGAQTLTSQGDNWSEYASQAACGSCHDDLDFSTHFGGQPDDKNCMSCHSLSGVAGSIANTHRDPSAALRGAFEARILAVSNTFQGEFPVIDFEIINPEQADQPYNILTDPSWSSAAGASLAVKVAWSTSDYTNTGNQGNNANSVSINALTDASANADGSFRVVSPVAIPNGSLPPNIAASGSGAAVIEGRAVVNSVRVPLTNVVSFFNIDEVDGSAVARRDVVALENCLACHGTLSLHGGNRTDNINSCVTCHNPRSTDIARRPDATTPPTDGKPEESVDFKTMVHAIHAGGFREQALQVVGFGGTVHVFKDAFPGALNNCLSCHIDGTYTLPMPSQVLASTTDTGADVQDPGDDTVTTRGSAVCSSCHDGASSKSHMLSNGGSFSTSQADIDNGLVVEQCQVCHAEGRVYSVSSSHGLD